MTKNVPVSLASAVQASRLADRFNLTAKSVQGKDKVSAVLTQAIEFMDSISDKLANGWELVTGNPYTWDDHFLNRSSAYKMGANKSFKDPVEQSLYDASELSSSSFRLDDAVAAKLKKITKAFNFSSDAESARLAIEAFEGMKDHLWRGNGLSFKKGDKRDAFDMKPYRK